LSRTFQSLELFEDLSVGENLLVGADAGAGRGGADRAEAERRARTAARSLDLDRLADRLPTSLSHAERARLAVGRAAATEPRLLLLDEPAAGLDAEERAALAGRVRQLAERGLGILVVDHDMGFVFAVCDQVCVLDLGEVIAFGPPSTVRADRRVAAAYLGGGPTPPRAGGHERDRAPTDGAPGPSTTPVVLDARRLTAGHGGVPVVHDVDLSVRAGEVVALLGPNGAGKTTTLAAMAGFLPVLSGSVVVLGEPAGGRPDRLARRGVAHVPQSRALFPELSVGEHLRLARRGRGTSFEDVLEVFPALRALLGRPASRLSGGEQQMLALGRALAGAHRLLMVDEVSLGLAPQLVEQVLDALRRVADQEGAGVLLVEQHVALALAVADRAVVMHAGRVVLEGPAATLAGDPALLEASYLGTQRPDEPPT